MSGSFASLAKLRTHTCRITLSFALNGLGVACNIEKRRATATGDPARPSRRAASASPACCRPESSPSPPYLLCDGDLASQSSGATGAEESRGVASEQGEEACSLFRPLSRPYHLLLLCGNQLCHSQQRSDDEDRDDSVWLPPQSGRHRSVRVDSCTPFVWDQLSGTRDWAVCLTVPRVATHRPTSTHV